MNGIGDIAGSALQAFSTSQQVTAHNVANLNTDEFKASRAAFQENGSGGVNATVSGTQDTVDISREAVNLLSNTAGFKANLKILKAADEMTKELLSIKA
jgi:flagellar basal-body rod protein FlgC